MKLHHFFDGKLAREEVASAFLATVLEQRSDFRESFFSALDIDEPRRQRLAARDWQVKVEHYAIDVMLWAPKEQEGVIIENKVQAGALQQGQLLRYYEEEVQREPGRNLVAVYLSPGGIGELEVDRLRKSPSFRSSRDVAVQLAWESLEGYGAGIKDSDPDQGFIASGFEQIFLLIEQSRKEQYPLIGARTLIEDVVKDARQQLQSRFPNIALRGWRAKNIHEIYSVRSNVTISIQLTFEVEEVPNFAPRGVGTRDSLTLAVASQVKLSGEGRKDLRRRQAWEAFTSSGHLDVPGVGRFERQGKEWLKICGLPVRGTVQAAAFEMARIGEAVIRIIQPYL